MNPEHAERLREVFADVLEKLAFIFAEPAEPDELQCEETDFISVQMEFTGEVMNGSLTLMVPAEYGAEISANVLGIDEDDEIAVEQAEDAQKEVLNVVCGQLLTAIAGDEPVFDLSVPTVSKADASDWEEITEDEDTVGFLLDESMAALRLRIAD